MVTTRRSNKDAHPGYVDRGERTDLQPSRLLPDTAATSRSTPPTAAERQLVIHRIADAERELLASQKQKLAFARQPSGPGMTKKPRSTANPPSNPVSTENGDGTYVL